MKNRTANRLGIVAVACAIIVSLASCARGRPEPAAPKPVRIGLLIPLTGGAASYGQNARKAAELAVREHAARPAAVPVELRIEDSRGEAGPGVSAATKLVNLDRVVGIVGCVTSGVTMAVAPLANEWQIPIVSPGASSPNVTAAGEYVFRTWPSDVFEATGIARFIESSGYRKIAVLRVANEYGLAMEKAVEKDLAIRAKSAIVAVETFDQGAREMRRQLQKLRAARPDALYFVGFPEAVAVFGRGYAAAGLKIPLLATSTVDDPQVLTATGGALEGTVFTRPLFRGPSADAFRSRYKASLGEDPGIVADTTYDAVALILRAINDASAAGAAITGREIHDRLLRVKDYDGASGTLSFDANGDVVKPVGLFRLTGGRFEELKP